MKKLTGLILLSTGLIFNNLKSIVLFEEPGKQSYEGLINAAENQDVNALNILDKAWDGEASEYSFIGNYLASKGYSKQNIGLKLASLIPQAPPMGPVQRTPSRRLDKTLLEQIQEKRKVLIKPGQPAPKRRASREDLLEQIRQGKLLRKRSVQVQPGPAAPVIPQAPPMGQPGGAPAASAPRQGMGEDLLQAIRKGKTLRRRPAQVSPDDVLQAQPASAAVPQAPSMGRPSGAPTGSMQEDLLRAIQRGKALRKTNVSPALRNALREAHESLTKYIKNPNSEDKDYASKLLKALEQNKQELTEEQRIKLINALKEDLNDLLGSPVALGIKKRQKAQASLASIFAKYEELKKSFSQASLPSSPSESSESDEDWET